MTTNDAYLASSPTTVRIRRLLSRYRIRISLTVVCALIATDMFRAVRPHSPFNLYDPWSAVGLSLVVLGACMRSWAAGILTKNSELSTTGPYAITRNPLYLGSFMMMFGFCTLLGTWHDFVAMLLLAILLYWPKIKGEEAHLHRKFGQQWEEYFAATPRLLPRHVKLRKVRSEWSVAQWNRNSEHVTMFAVIAGLVIIEFWSKMLP